MKRIAFITDIHLDEQFPIDNNINSTKNLELVLADIVKKEITDVVFGGDIGELTAYSYFFNALKQFSVKFILGNHDKFENVKEYVPQNIEKNELYYKYEDDNYHYLFLDTSQEELSNTQLKWLKEELNSASANSIPKNIIVFLHHPVLEINTAVDKLYPLKNREQLKSVLLNYENNVTVFCGHYHMNDEQHYQNIKQFTTQSLSYQLEKNAPEIKVDNSIFGYRIIELKTDTIETQLITFKNN